MQKIFKNPGEVEKLAKQKYGIPDFLMMENAAISLKNFILEQSQNKNLSQPSVFIYCGKGNNGGDGFALARLLYSKADLTVFCPVEPSAAEAKTQYNICLNMGIKICTELPEFNKSYDFVVDCLYGTGFHGQLSDFEKSIFDTLNGCGAVKVACDIPSALYFKADYTITMGTYKTILFSDNAKATCGKILCVQIGLPEELFTKDQEPEAYLVTCSDKKLPLRLNAKGNKGTFGHTLVISGEKAGASIIAATAALNFGSGLTTLLKTNFSNLEQFKISPELMISQTLPEKTSAIVAGPGLGINYDFEQIITWCREQKSPKLVLDADFFNHPQGIKILQSLCTIPDIQIVLTPHLSELNRFLVKLKTEYKDLPLTQEDIQIKNLSENTDGKIKAGKIITKLFPQVTLIMKSANTFIAHNEQTFIVTDGAVSLAKGGSGDVLAGMTGALLAQGYNALDAAITACQTHAEAGFAFGKQAFDLTPEKLISQLWNM